MGKSADSMTSWDDSNMPRKQILSAYLDAAALRIVSHSTREGVYATIKGLDDVWAFGATEDIAIQHLKAALEAHIVDSIFRHCPLPAFDGISLQITERSKYGERVVYQASAPSGEIPFWEIDDDDRAR